MTYEELRKRRVEWLKGLKAGDEVGVTDYYRNNPGSVGRVLRCTATQLIVSLPERHAGVGEVRFNADSGQERASGVRTRELVEPTQEFKDSIERAGLASELGLAITHSTLERMSLDKLRALATIIDPQAKSLLVSFSPAEGEGPWELVARAAKQLSEMGLPMPIGIHQELSRVYGLNESYDEHLRS